MTRSKALWFAQICVLTHFLLGLGVDLGLAQQTIPESAIPSTITRDSEIVPTGEPNGICIGNTGTPQPSITLCSTVDLTGKSLLFKLPEFTVATLPASHAMSIVTDGSTPSDCTTGKGTTRVLCHWNGAAWAAIGGGGGTGTLTAVLQTDNEICVASSTGPQPQVSLCPAVIATGKTVQLGRVDLAGVITPAVLTADTADWNPTNLATASTIRVSANAARTLSGIQGGVTGRILTLINVGTFPIILANDRVSTSSYRFSLGADLILGPSQGLIIQYDPTDARWRALGGIGGGSTYAADTGTVNTFVMAPSPAITAYTVGQRYSFKALNSNTAASTLAISGLTATPLKKPVGGVATDLAANDIRGGQMVDVVYDGVNFQMTSQLGTSPTGITGLTTNCLTRALTASSVENSSLCEDVDSVNSTKSFEVGDVSANSYEVIGTGVTGHQQLKFLTMRTKSISFRIGSNSGATLVDTQDETNVWENNIAAMHITAVKCRTDQGTSRINLNRSGAGSNILSAAYLECTTGGATSTTFTSGQDALAVGDRIDFQMVTGAQSGTPKWVLVTITASVDSGS